MNLTYADYMETPLGFRQRDLVVTQKYDASYLLSRYMPIEENVWDLAKARMEVLRVFVPPFNGDRGLTLLDYGGGLGHVAIAARSAGYYAYYTDLVEGRAGVWLHPDDDWPAVDVLTCFDSLEHLPDPAKLIRDTDPLWVMISVPACWHPLDEAWFMAWKHRRPGEHLWHWDSERLSRFMGLLGYQTVMHSVFEDKWRPNPAQQEPNILTGIFKRVKAPAQEGGAR